ncbi:MAG: beta-ketoacyl-ACP synthase II [Actinomycetota bacterium]|nr:beta-ketoacyl-ACP synthase II [Actinomycetota bacterium]
MLESVAGRRVAVTGVGVVAPCGVGAEAFWAGLLTEPTPAVRRTVPGWDPSPWLEHKDARHTDRFAQFAIAAAEMALDDAGRPGVEPARGGVSIGTGIGGIGTLEMQSGVLAERGARRVSPYTIPMIMPNGGAAAVSMRNGWHGPSETIVTACAAGTHSVAAGAKLIASGRCDVVLAGGSESVMTPTTIAGFTNMTALSRSGISRPFDAERDGFCIAEGAGVLVLEELQAALARGAHVYGEIAGTASNADAYHITAPSPGGGGAAACMRLALADAGVEPGDVRQVNAHGTSTPLNDAAEAAAITTVFGPEGPAVTSIKGVLGHTLGAAGAIEAVAVALSFQHRLIPPTAGTSLVDPEVHVDVVTAARRWEPGPTLSNSFGFGGHNGCLVMLPA